MTASPEVGTRQTWTSKSTQFEVTPVHRGRNEVIAGHEPGRYQKLVLKAANGKYLGVSQARAGLIVADRDLQEATIFILDLTRGDRTGFFVYRRLFTYGERSMIPNRAKAVGTYFFRYGNDTAFRIKRRGGLGAGSLFQIFTTKDPRWSSRTDADRGDDMEEWRSSHLSI
jgi:hypothetical protein